MKPNKSKPVIAEQPPVESFGYDPKLLTPANVKAVKAIFPELDHFDCAMLFIFLGVFDDPMAQAEKLSAGCKFSDAATALAIIRNKAHAVMIQKLNVLSNEP